MILLTSLSEFLYHKVVSHSYFLLIKKPNITPTDSLTNMGNILYCLYNFIQNALENVKHFPPKDKYVVVSLDLQVEGSNA